MEIDTARIKADHPLIPFFTERHQLQFTPAAYSTFKSRCPFHAERTSSFYVYPDQHYHCYGCGAHGDIFEYFKQTEGLDFLGTAERLSGKDREKLLSVRKPAPTPVATPPEAPLHRLTEAQRETWQSSCDRLLRPEHLQHWSEWRGLSPELLADCARHGLMGIHPYYQQQREAFLIQAPAAAYTQPEIPSGSLLAHSLHVRLAPRSVGNDHASASWRYDPPSGIKVRSVSFPFLLGRFQTHIKPSEFHVEQFPSFRYLLFTEGQWDALALADALGWRTLADIPAHTLIIGLRGATSWRRFLDHCLPRPQHAVGSALPTALCFGDNDRAGDQWYAPGGFIDQLREVTSRTHTFRPAAPGCKDLNDLWKNGHLQTDQLRSLLRRALGAISPESTPVQPTFLSYLRSQRLHPHLQPAISHVLSDPHKPSANRPATIWSSYLNSTPFAADLLSLWRTWAAQ